VCFTDSVFAQRMEHSATEMWDISGGIHFIHYDCAQTGQCTSLSLLFI